ncbi:unnamed protein product [Bursaphelenchus xylophilus]|uniref:(pine wood nematode) hypothetical protein n=1 Tax=Bursaphelenchus xylophilus TaxID=6326 RepID=A0A1I7S149_BURXY|nr:unnamed protein product [Bursaphelenchus xylophilus]CAG9079974.1 unnamed protein product [Bursaphelenchus xylophilus]
MIFKFPIWLLISQNFLLSAYARFVLYRGNGSEFNSHHTTPIMYLPQEDGFVEMKRLTVNFGRPLLELLADCRDDPYSNCDADHIMPMCNKAVYNNIMRRKCRKTCGFCEGDDTPNPNPVPSTESCADDKTTDCQKPSVRILCNDRAYRRLMAKKCARTCGDCTTTTATSPTTQTTGTTDFLRIITTISTPSSGSSGTTATAASTPTTSDECPPDDP